MGKQALRAGSNRDSEDAAGVDGAAAGVDAGLQGVNAQMVQALMRSAGLGGASAPSMRKLRRLLASTPEAYLMARAGSAAKR